MSPSEDDPSSPALEGPDPPAIWSPDQIVRDFVTLKGGIFLVVTENQNFYLNLRNTAVRFLQLPDTSIRPIWPPDALDDELRELRIRGVPAVCFIGCEVTGTLCTDLTSQVRELHPDARVIILTFGISRDVLVYLHEEGADDVIVMPVSPDSIIRKIAQTLRPRGSLNPLFENARQHLSRREFDKAMECAESILAAKPGSPGGYIVLGDALRGMGRHQEAMDAYSSASRSGILFLDPLKKIAEVHHELGHLGEELEYLEQLEELSPLNVERKVAIGANYLRLGDQDNAQRAFDNAYRVAAGRQLHQQAMVSRMIADHVLEFAPDYSERYLRQALDESAEHPRNQSELLNRLGLALRRQGRWQEAIEEYAKALKLSPDSPVLLYNTAMAYFEGDETEKAVQVLDRVLALEPEFASRNPQAGLNIAKAFVKAGRRSEARPVLEAAMAAEPGLEGVEELERILGREAPA